MLSIIACNDKQRITIEQACYISNLLFRDLKPNLFSLDEQNNILKEAQETQKKTQQKVKDLEYKLKNASALREKELKEADKRVAESKKKMENSAAKSKDHLQVCPTS